MRKRKLTTTMIYQSIRNLFLLFLFVFLSTDLSAQDQNQDRNLALQFYQNEQYDKAAELFEKLYNEDPNSNFLYRYLFNSYILLKEYRQAERLARRSYRRNRDNLNFLVDVGYVYLQSGESDRAKREFDNAISELSANERQIRSLANAFNSIREFDYAVAAYEKGRDLLNDQSKFHFDVAGIYMRKDNPQKAIESYLDHLDHFPNQSQNLKNALQFRLDQESLSRALRSQLYSRIQRNPQSLVFPELLIWLLIQEDDFEAAFRQVRALDRRFNEDGKRVMELARTAFSEEDYQTAINAFDYVIEKGRQNPHYRAARMEQLSAKKQKLITRIDFTTEDIEELDGAFVNYLDEFGYSRHTVRAVLDRAALHALYLHNLNRGIELLEKALELPQLDAQTAANARLDLGDYYLMRGDIWDASLLYSQVEKSLRDNPLTEEARYRNARLSYFRGDFQWAQTQLNVLKAATSNFVSNDAIRLSVFIGDHLNLDTTDTPLRLFADAELLVMQNRFDDALNKMQLIDDLFPAHSLAPAIKYRKADIFIQRRDFEKAIDKLENLVMHHPDYVLTDKAVFRLGEISERYLQNKQRAMDWYEELVVNYHDSIYVVEARKRFRQLRGDTF